MDICGDGKAGGWEAYAIFPPVWADGNSMANNNRIQNTDCRHMPMRLCGTESVGGGMSKYSHIPGYAVMFRKMGKCMRVGRGERQIWCICN